MKTLIKRISLTPILFVLFFILIFFTPSNLAKSPETVRNAVITCIGVDKTGDEFEVTLVSFVPTAGKDFVENYEVTSTKGASLSESITKAELQLGKDIKLFHTEAAILGQGVLEEDVSVILDFFAREESLSPSCILIGTNNEAKKLLEFLQENDSNPNERLSDIMMYNSNMIYCKETSVESFYNGYFSPTKSSFIAYMQFKEQDDDEGILLSTGSGGQSGSSQTKEKPKGSVINDGSVVLFREGKKVMVLDPKIVDGTNWLNCEQGKKIISIDNYSDEEYKDAKIVFYLDNKDLIRSTRFENGVPIYTASLRLYVDRIEIYGQKTNEKQNLQLSGLNENVIKELEHTINIELKDALDILREKKSDVVGVWREFYEKSRGEFKKFIKDLKDPDDFLNYILFEVNVYVLPD